MAKLTPINGAIHVVSKYSTVIDGLLWFLGKVNKQSVIMAPLSSNSATIRPFVGPLPLLVGSSQPQSGLWVGKNVNQFCFLFVVDDLSPQEEWGWGWGVGGALKLKQASSWCWCELSARVNYSCSQIDLNYKFQTNIDQACRLYPLEPLDKFAPWRVWQGRRRRRLAPFAFNKQNIIKQFSHSHRYVGH